jgi:hypothetical protein
VQDQHHQPCAVARLGPFQHLLVAGRVAKRRVGPLADKQVDPDGLAGIVVDEKYLGSGQELGKRLNMLVEERLSNDRFMTSAARFALDLQSMDTTIK